MKRPKDFGSFNKNEIAYLKGEQFSNGLWLTYQKSKLNYQIDLITEVLAAQNVVHIGCCDHLPIIDEKIQKDQWVHGIISRVANNCLGIDINEPAVTYLKKKHNITNIVCADITGEKIESISNKQWDCFYLGELIEHINDPHLFLKTIRDHYVDSVERIIITTPNAFAYANHKNAKRNKECINSDHRFWFTPFTLAKVLFNTGYSNISFGLVEPGRKKRLTIKSILKRPAGLLKHFRKKNNPLQRETIIMIASL